MADLRLTYTQDNEGITHNMVFETTSDMAGFCASLIVKSQMGQKIVIKSFNGPMGIAKLLFTALPTEQD